ncbi:hypothetical protein EVAR_92706_1 [Eumeta japonica]|uniref:Uncharacterized protein n=1 Tax=Eumeta variegata TaxID=151549 RepID=A0A4C1T016_EUMVA|nr:hypothetical protein EVAR_92706_1 [Eumeta japonica]
MPGQTTSSWPPRGTLRRGTYASAVALSAELSTAHNYNLGHGVAATKVSRALARRQRRRDGNLNVKTAVVRVPRAATGRAGAREEVQQEIADASPHRAADDSLRPPPADRGNLRLFYPFLGSVPKGYQRDFIAKASPSNRRSITEMKLIHNAVTMNASTSYTSRRCVCAGSSRRPATPTPRAARGAAEGRPLELG